MNILKELTRAFHIVMGSGLASVFLLASNTILARVLPAETYGNYTIAFTLTNGGMFLAVFGLTQLLLQEYGRNQSFTAGFVRSALFIQLAVTLLSCLGLALVAFVIHVSHQARLLTLVLLPVLVAQATGDIASVYFQIQRIHWLSGGWIAILNFLRLICSLLFIFTSSNIYVLAFYQAVISLFYVSASVVLTLRMYRQNCADSPPAGFADATKRVFREASPYAISSVMFYAVAQLPLVLIGTLTGSAGTAIYGVAFLIMQAFYFVPQTLMVRYLLMKYHVIATTNRAGLSRILSRGTLLAGIAGAAIALPAYLAIPPIVTLVFGSKYAVTIGLVQIMLICVPIRFMTVNLAAVIVSGVSIWHKNYADLASGLFSVVCYLLLVSHDPVRGGAYAAVLTELVVLAAHYVLIDHYM
jgi:O-antigen/teichoic acid export membrane protein